MRMPTLEPRTQSKWISDPRRVNPSPLPHPLPQSAAGVRLLSLIAYGPQLCVMSCFLVLLSFLLCVSLASSLLGCGHETILRDVVFVCVVINAVDSLLVCSLLVSARPYSACQLCWPFSLSLDGDDVARFCISVLCTPFQFRVASYLTIELHN